MEPLFEGTWDLAGSFRALDSPVFLRVK